MNLETALTAGFREGDAAGKYPLTIITREYTDDGPAYVVAECLEIPGCVGQGDTKEDAEKDLEQALNLCLTVMFEDFLKTATSAHPVPDLRGISSQRKLSVSTSPQLQYA